MAQDHSTDPNEELERWFDAFIEDYREALKRRGDSVTIINPERIKAVEYVYSLMKNLLKDSDAKVTYKLNDPDPSYGSVTVEGKLLEFLDPELFIKAAEVASNAEVYSLKNDKVRLSFGFLHLTIPIKE